MALHGFHRRSPQDASLSSADTSIDGSIGPNQATASLDGSIVSATQNSVLTIITTSETIIPAATGTNIPQPTVIATTITVTDSASLQALTSTSSSSTSRSASSTASAAASSSASSSANSSSSSLSTLIPAIVVPVAVVLLASLGLFWFFMRRRHLRELENTPFDMAGKGEKLASRSTSNRSTGSPISSVVMKSTPAVSVSQVYPASDPQPAPRIPLNEIGIARPLTPQDSDSPGARPRSPGCQYSPVSRDRQQYQNFSGPRPSAAWKGPPSRSGPLQGRDRSISPRGPSPVAYGQKFYPPRKPSGPRSSPSPVLSSGSSPPLSGGPRALPGPPRAAPAPPGPPANRMRDLTPTIGTGLSPTKRAPAPPALVAPPPGAFNGGSPISQYSPIVKETPNIASALASNASSKTKANPSKALAPIVTTRNLPALKLSKSPTSPGAFLTEENLRIARLAGSSKLGSMPASDSPSDLSPAYHVMHEVAMLDNQNLSSPETASYPSPKLPPPATLSQLIPSHSPKEDRKVNYFNSPSRPVSGASSQYPPTASGVQPYLNSKLPHQGGGRHEGRHDVRATFVSELDNYEDIDAKSDISSLNEFNGR
ncbi:hypothetical protein DV737_g1113, partial [Chaetothyriales sp. CBS 132003]